MSEQDIYEKQGFGNRAGIGNAPALVFVDFTVGFNDPEHFGGGNIDDAVQASVGLLARARELGLPIAFTRVVYAEDGSDAGVFARKVPALLKLTETSPLGQIVPELAPRAGERIVRKTQASAFFGTDFLGWLIMHRADTLLIAGCTTSGCIRATVIDSVSHNFRTIVVRDCVGDRAMGPHDANLFDMEQKYADVMTRDEVLAALDDRAVAAE